MKKYRFIVILFLLFIVSRVIFLNTYPGWHADEARYFQFIKNFSQGIFELNNFRISIINPWVAHGPLFIFAYGIPGSIAGHDTLFLRIISILFALLGLFFLYRTAEMMKKGSGYFLIIISTLFFILNIWERCVLPYVMLFPLYSAILFYYMSYLKKEKTVYLSIISILIGISTMVSYYSFSLLPVFWFILFRKKIRNLSFYIYPIIIIMLTLLIDLILNGKYALWGIREMFYLFIRGDKKNFFEVTHLYFQHIFEYMSIHFIIAAGTLYLLLKKESRIFFYFFIVISFLHFIRPIYFISLHQYPITAYTFVPLLGFSFLMHDIFSMKKIYMKAVFFLIMFFIAFPNYKIITKDMDYPLSHLAMNSYRYLDDTVQYLESNTGDNVVIATRHIMHLLSVKRAEFAEWAAFEGLTVTELKENFPNDWYLYDVNMNTIKYILIDPYFFYYNRYQSYVTELNRRYRIFEYDRDGKVVFLWDIEKRIGDFMILRNPRSKQ